jgi:hypothetical protein
MDMFKKMKSDFSSRFDNLKKMFEFLNFRLCYDGTFDL